MIKMIIYKCKIQLYYFVSMIFMILISNNRTFSSFPKPFLSETIQEEFRKHDRLMTQSFYFFQSLAIGEKKSEWIASAYLNNEEFYEKSICFVIFTQKRLLPYIKTNLYILLNGHEKQDIFNNMEIHILNIEKDLNSQEYLSFIHDLPFIKIHELHDILEESKNINKYKKAFQICLESNIYWCTFISDDCIPSINLLLNFQSTVIFPYYKKEEELSYVNLFKNSNHLIQSVNNKIKELITKERNLRNEELNDSLYHYSLINYVLNNTNSSSEDGDHKPIAMAFPLTSVRDFLILFENGIVENSINDFDILLYTFNQIYPDKINKQIEPSIVNHIGYYGPKEQNQFIMTDIRFAAY